MRYSDERGRACAHFELSNVVSGQNFEKLLSSNEAR
jgi:hypothetical protein